MKKETMIANEVSNLEVKKVNSEVKTPMSLKTLEKMRTRGLSVPASKFSLETICGASCETSAQ